MLQCGNTTCNYEWLVKWQSSDRSDESDKSSHCLIMGLLASKVRWLELSQLSLCLEFDKENLMKFLLNSLLLLIHFTTVAMHLLSHGPHVTLAMWHTVTVTVTWPSIIPIVTLWQSHLILSHAPSYSCKSNKKRKEKEKEI